MCISISGGPQKTLCLLKAFVSVELWHYCMLQPETLKYFDVEHKAGVNGSSICFFSKYFKSEASTCSQPSSNCYICRHMCVYASERCILFLPLHNYAPPCVGQLQKK